jgi:hypothetical protein
MSGVSDPIHTEIKSESKENIRAAAMSKFHFLESCIFVERLTYYLISFQDPELSDASVSPTHNFPPPPCCYYKF